MGRHSSGSGTGTDSESGPGTQPPAGTNGDRTGGGEDWQGPGQRAVPGGPGKPRHTSPGFRSRFAIARARRTRRMTFIWGGAAVVAIAIIVTVTVLELGGQSKPKVVIPGLVTHFQRGEFKTVPTACRSVSAATLTKYLPGQRRMFAPRPFEGRAQSLCDWTLDAPPVYRTLSVTVQAYPPSALANGNGSATANATGVYQAALEAKLKPPKSTHLPAATVSKLPLLGNGGFAALQVVTTHGATTDLMTVTVRDRNVVVTVVMEGFSGRKGKYTPVSQAQLEAGATAAAKDVLSQVR